MGDHWRSKDNRFKICKNVPDLYLSQSWVEHGKYTCKKEIYNPATVDGINAVFRYKHAMWRITLSTDAAWVCLYAQSSLISMLMMHIGNVFLTSTLVKEPRYSGCQIHLDILLRYTSDQGEIRRMQTNSSCHHFHIQLPQVLKLSGCDYFFTQKLSWNNINKFPLSTFYWVGIDGTRILAHLTPADT